MGAERQGKLIPVDVRELKAKDQYRVRGGVCVCSFLGVLYVSMI